MRIGYIMAVLCIPGIPEAVLAGSEIHGARTVVASRTSTPPVVDGHLGDPCWELAAPASGFVLLDPAEGVPAANQTFVRVLYTEDELYIGLYMSDSNPENIDARIVPRDGRFAPRDLVGIVLDTHHDHRNAYGFYVNPLGIQHDFQMTDDGAGGYGANNKGWDGVWRAEAAVLDSGWSAELAISFSTLAFAGGEEMVWVGVQRGAPGRHRQGAQPLGGDLPGGRVGAESLEGGSPGRPAGDRPGAAPGAASPCCLRPRPA